VGHEWHPLRDISGNNGVVQEKVLQGKILKTIMAIRKAAIQDQEGQVDDLGKKKEGEEAGLLKTRVVQYFSNNKINIYPSSFNGRKAMNN
jgi:hypothetical protein